MPNYCYDTIVFRRKDTSEQHKSLFKDFVKAVKEHQANHKFLTKMYKRAKLSPQDKAKLRNIIIDGGYDEAFSLYEFLPHIRHGGDNSTYNEGFERAYGAMHKTDYQRQTAGIKWDMWNTIVKINKNVKKPYVTIVGTTAWGAPYKAINMICKVYDMEAAMISINESDDTLFRFTYFGNQTDELYDIYETVRMPKSKCSTKQEIDEVLVKHFQKKNLPDIWKIFLPN